MSELFQNVCQSVEVAEVLQVRNLLNFRNAFRQRRTCFICHGKSAFPSYSCRRLCRTIGRIYGLYGMQQLLKSLLRSTTILIFFLFMVWLSAFVDDGIQKHVTIVLYEQFLFLVRGGAVNLILEKSNFIDRAMTHLWGILILFDNLILLSYQHPRNSNVS
jgi:hypothetical protein